MKKSMMNFIVVMQINIEIFYKLILSFWLCITRQAQSIQNNLAYLCSISRNVWVMKWFFFCLQIYTKCFCKLVVSLWNWCYHFRCAWLSIPKLPKIKSLLFLRNILKKKWITKFIYIYIYIYIYPRMNDEMSWFFACWYKFRKDKC